MTIERIDVHKVASANIHGLVYSLELASVASEALFGAVEGEYFEA